MEGSNGARSVDGEQLFREFVDRGLGFLEFGVAGGGFRLLHGGEVIADRIWEDEVSVSEPLHEGARAETVCAVIRKVRFAEHIETGKVTHQVVINPEAAH